MSVSGANLDKGAKENEMAELRARLDEAEQTLNAIRSGSVDALLINGPTGDHVFTLRGSDLNYRLLIESMGEGAITATDDGTILYCNKKFGHMVSRSAEKIVGRKVVDFVKQEDRSGLHCLFSQPIASTTKCEITLLGSADVELAAQLSVTPLDLEGVHGLSIIVTDLTETKMAIQLADANRELEKKAADLIRSNNELARFAFVASHDLKEPLRVVSNYVQLFDKIYAEKLDTESKKYMRFITASVDRMYDLINDLLSYSSINSLEAEPAKLDLNAIVGEALENLGESINETSAKILVDPLPPATGDHNQFLQLFQNLIGNAVKYHGEAAPIIKIECSYNKNEYTISVSDNGIGIDSVYFDRIFILFQRLHAKGKYDGTGIGLSVCKKIIERLGGQIWVESELGRGSKFSFTIPINP